LQKSRQSSAKSKHGIVIALGHIFTLIHDLFIMASLNNK